MESIKEYEHAMRMYKKAKSLDIKSEFAEEISGGLYRMESYLNLERTHATGSRVQEVG